MSQELRPIDQVRLDLKKMEPQFKSVLPDNVTPERFTRVALTAIQNDLELLNCDRGSLFNALMKCSTDGLIPDGREAALVRFKNKVSYMPMIGGILKLVRNSGELLSITSNLVHKNDTFKMWIDDNGEHLNHEPQLNSERGEVVGVYAMARTKDGGLFIEYMNMKQINDVKNVSRSKENGPWSGNFATEMMRKTVVRRLAKRLPMSTDLDEVIRRDDELYDLEQEKPAVKIKTVEEVKDQIEAVPVEQIEAPKEAIKEEEPKKVKEKVIKGDDVALLDRAKIAQEILGIIEYLGWSQNDMQAFCYEKFGKYSKQLTNEELANCLEILKKEANQ